ncbi:MAG: FG-GAP repeat domain-containing protein [Chloroflexota bacterium]
MNMKRANILMLLFLFASVVSCRLTGPAPADVQTPGAGQVTVPAAAAIFRLVYTEDTPGIRSGALWDANDDGYLDIAFATPRSVQFIINENGTGNFNANATYKVSSGTGWGALDFNRDGKLDLHLNTEDYGSAISSSASNISFTDIGTETQQAVIRNSLFADFDGDGYTDTFLTTSSFGNRHQWPLFFRGNASRAFDNVNIIDTILGPNTSNFWHGLTPPASQLPSADQACANEDWATKQIKGGIVRDFDQDGKPDVLLSVYADAGFQDERCLQFATERAYLSERGLYYLRNISTPGKIAFEEAAASAFGDVVNGQEDTIWNPYHALALDYDNDGDLDVFIGAKLRSGRLSRGEDTRIVSFFENNGDGQFADKTASTGFQWLNDLPPSEKDEISLAAGGAFDYDNDGYVDLILVNRNGMNEPTYQHVFVFRNRGDKTFEQISPVMHGMDGNSGRDMTYGDFNNDGYLDTVIMDGEGGGTQGSDDAQVYFNTLSTSGNHWLGIDVVSPDGSPAIGAKVTIYDPMTHQILGYDEVRTDFSYRSKKTPRVYFGLGTRTSVMVEVEYFGKKITLTNATPDTVMKVVAQ